MARIKDILNREIDEIKNIDTHINPHNDILPQIENIIELSSEEWQTVPLLINLPSLNYSAAILLTILHGKMGYFPAIIRMKPEEDTIPPNFVVAEVVNLQAARLNAREKR